MDIQITKISKKLLFIFIILDILDTSAAVANSEKADELLGISYRFDGMRHIDGFYSTFNNPQTPLKEPGLNCSGFLIEALRKIYDDPISYKEAIFDTNRNSGKDAYFGQDWDFGSDLIQNLAMILGNGKSMRSMHIKDVGNLKALFNGFDPRSNYLVAFGKPRRKKNRLFYLFHHVGLFIPSHDGNVWLYHSTRRSGSHKLNLSKASGFNRFARQFGKTALGYRLMKIIELRKSKR